MIEEDGRYLTINNEHVIDKMKIVKVYIDHVFIGRWDVAIEVKDVSWWFNSNYRIEYDNYGEAQKMLNRLSNINEKIKVAQELDMFF